MDLENVEPIETVASKICPNLACHCLNCECGETCNCSFLERCECITAPGVLELPKEEPEE